MRRLTDGPAALSPSARVTATVAMAAGGLLVLWSSAIHAHLWLSVGYRHIPTIGPLFLLQSVAGLLLGLAILVLRRTWVAVTGAGYVGATLVGFLITVQHGLFGFRDSWSAPFASLAFVVEALAFALLTLASALCLIGPEAAVQPGVVSTGDPIPVGSEPGQPRTLRRASANRARASTRSSA